MKERISVRDEGAMKPWIVYVFLLATSRRRSRIVWRSQLTEESKNAHLFIISLTLAPRNARKISATWRRCSSNVDDNKMMSSM